MIMVLIKEYQSMAGQIAGAAGMIMLTTIARSDKDLS
jgi:hypothetical protein